MAFNNSEYVKDKRKAAMVGKERQRMGVVAGTPDLILLVPRIRYISLYLDGQYGPRRSEHPCFVPGLLIEMKTPTGRLQENQIFRHEHIATQGFDVQTCYSDSEAIETIVRYMNEQPIA